MNKSDAINELAAALAKAQGAMSPAKMDAVNPFLRNKYADLASVISAIRTPLAANGLSVSQHPSISDDGAVTVTTLLAHASGQWLESSITLPLDGSKGLSTAQSMGAIVTYLRRYSLSAILGIAADEDTDGNDAKRPIQAPRVAAVPTPASLPTPRSEAPAAQTFNDAALVQGEYPLPLVTLEEAREMVTSKGVKYGAMDEDGLAAMASYIWKHVRATGPNDASHAGSLRKLAGINVLLHK